MKKIFAISTLLLSLALGSCDSYLDINQDPNSPNEEAITTDMLLPAAEMNLATSYGDFLRIAGGYFAQHFSQTFGTSNYLDYSQFQMSAVRSSSTYTQLNSRCLKSLKTIREKAVAENDFATNLAATTLWAFTYQVLVDCYGELPYKEAFDTSNPTPNYDDGQDIYAGVIAELEEALAQPLNTKSATSYLYDSAADWEQFAKAVLLKLYMRESGAVDVQAKLDALVAEDNFPTEDVAFAGIWNSEAGHMSPFYAEEFATNWGSTQTNVIGNIAIIGTMQQTDGNGDVVFEDGRLSKFFATNGSGAYTGGVSGTNFSTTADLKSGYWCRPQASYDMPVYLITRSEIEFFLAEYYAKKGNAALAQTHYEAAVEESFATAGADGADEAIAQIPFNLGNYKQVLGVAKWIALAGTNNFEAWCEMRRLGYPTFGTVTGNDLYNEGTDRYAPDKYVPGTLYTPIKVNGNLGNNKVLQRWPYAESSTSRNQNAPKQDETVYGTPVFWAK